ncbi:NAD(P)-binding domain-containing protein [Amnibacterium endophyticum]|uniref:NAD(P)-binding domain-containing protein n=1 Tax=Amnibacterium endophyticum TaxID=2109337 RepID=A0ABW4LFE8_9MICO
MDTTPQRTRFAFLVHPRTDVRADLAGVHPLLGLVPSGLIERSMARLPLKPWVHATIEASDAQGEVLGEIITLPLSPRLLLGPDRALVQRRVDEAVDLAVSRGAEIVGLGALTAPVTAGGAKLRRRTDVGVTNGNAFTAAITVQAVERVVGAFDEPPVVALVGATGSVGTAVARATARAGIASELLLVGRTPSSLAALAGSLDASWSTDLADCRRADVIVLMTSAADAVLGSEHLKPGAVVVDDTQPRNTSERLAAERPDVVIVDGGVVATPGLVRRGHPIGLPDDRSFACLAETALLALGGHRGHGTIGRPSLEDIDRMTGLSARFAHLGFRLAAPTAFGRPVAVPGWNAPAVLPAPSRAEETVA